MAVNRNDIALCLSGGGIRAVAFHLGVLRYLAEKGLLERIRHISSVSGGSLFVGMVYRANEWSWPTSAEYLSSTHSRIAQAICSRSMQAGAITRLLWPQNWRYLLSRANLLSIELRSCWGFDVPLSAIGPNPEWSINGTTAENGKRFRFKGSSLGDWELGYAQAPDFSLADALAVSAAFPIGFGPLMLRADKQTWMKREWGEVLGSEKVVKSPYKRLHLYDGGLYDNLGAESFFHPGRQVEKIPNTYILVSDAGAPLPVGLNTGPLNPFRIKRMMDIMSEQCRSLRVRAFSNYLQANPDAGAYLWIAAPVRKECEEQARFAREFPTSLKRLDPTEAHQLSDHGYAVTAEVDERYGIGKTYATHAHEYNISKGHSHV